KELIAFAALVVAVAAARTFRDYVGDMFKTSGLEAHVAQIVGAATIFIVVALVLNVLGRLFLRKLRDPDKEGQLAGAAQKAVVAADGESKHLGPVTMFTKPFAAAEKGFIYWTDKIGGGVLGIAKGAIAAYLVFGIVYYADLAS